MNEEQLALLSTRNTVEMKINEIDGIKVAMEEIAAVEDVSKDVVEEDVKEEKNSFAEELESQKHEIEELRQKLENEETLRLNAERKCAELEEVNKAKEVALNNITSVHTPDFQATLQKKVSVNVAIDRVNIF